MWFTNSTANSVGWVTPSGLLNTYTSPLIYNPQGITAGPDGALWFANFYASSIGRVTTTGAVTAYSDPKISFPVSIVKGPDGAMWFTNPGNNTIGRIAMDGTVTNYSDSTVSSPIDITAGPDGAMWFTNYGNNSIGRITTGRRDHQLRRSDHLVPRRHLRRSRRRHLVHERGHELDREDQLVSRVPRRGVGRIVVVAALMAATIVPVGVASVAGASPGSPHTEGTVGVGRLAAGSSHSCALSSAGTVSCWGLNSSGQLGNNSVVNARFPVAVKGLSGVTSRGGRRA